MKKGWKVITKEAVELLRIGQSWGRYKYEIKDLMVKQYAVALRDANPLWFDEKYAKNESNFDFRYAPSAFFTAINPLESGTRGIINQKVSPQNKFLSKLSGEPEESIWTYAAYTGVEYEDEPIRVGDTIFCEVFVKDVYEKESSKNILVFVENEVVMSNQENVYIGKGTVGVVKMFPKN